MERLEQRYLNQYKDEELAKDEISPELYCVACNKDFKSLKSFQNHEGSKKHKQNVELVKKSMTEEERNFQKSQNLVEPNLLTKETIESESDEIPIDEMSESFKDSDLDENLQKAPKKVKKTKKKNKVELHYESGSETELKYLSITEKDKAADWDDEKKVKLKKIKPQHSIPTVECLDMLLNKEADGSDEGAIASKKSNKKRLGRCSGYGRGHYMSETH